MIPKRAIIIGGGFSIRENLWNTDINDLPIWKHIWNEFTIGTNWVFRWFTPTILMYADYQFYGTEKERLKNIPLILGKDDGAYKRKNGVCIDKNVILLKECERKQKVTWNENTIGLHSHYWGKEAWVKGWYSSQLIGLKALNIAIALDCTELYLLGFDACGDEQGRTHFYADTSVGQYTWNEHKHNGTGKTKHGYYRTGNYNKVEELNKKWFQPFEEELKKGIKIYNVSLNSKIDTFPKISYKTFYKMLQNNVIHANHEIIRDYIKCKLL